MEYLVAEKISSWSPAMYRAKMRVLSDVEKGARSGRVPLCCY